MKGMTATRGIRRRLLDGGSPRRVVVEERRQPREVQETPCVVCGVTWQRHHNRNNRPCGKWTDERTMSEREAGRGINWI